MFAGGHPARLGRRLAAPQSASSGPSDYGKRRWLILTVVSAAQFLCVLDLWVVNIALPALERDFAPATLSDVAWILNIYTILLAALLVPTGRLADSLGRRRLFLVGLVLFGSASVGCALAPLLPVLIGWRGVQAVGAAVLLPSTLGLALPAFAPRQRGTAVGIWAAVGSVAAGLGPVLGGLLVESSWRWIFLINLPIVVATFVAGALVLPRDGRRVQQPVDRVGSLLLLAGVGLVCGGLIQAPVWPAPLTWLALGAAVVLAAAFVRHALRHPAPVIPPRLFAIRHFGASVLSLLAYYVGFGALLLSTTLLLTQRLQLSVLVAAIGIAPAPIVAGIIAPFSGRVVARIGIRNTVLVGAGAFGTAAAWPLIVAGDSPTYLAAILPTMLLWGLANALIQPTLFTAADAAPPAELASSAAVLSVTRQLGAALGVALLVLVLSAGGPDELIGFRYAWALIVLAAALTAAAGVWLDQRLPASHLEPAYAEHMTPMRGDHSAARSRT